MAAQGIKPAALLHTTGPQLRSLTVTHHQQQQGSGGVATLPTAADQPATAVQQRAMQQQTVRKAGLTRTGSSSSGRNVTWALGSSVGTQQHANDASTAAAAAAAGTGSRRVQAAACLAAAAAAAAQYSSSKKAGAAAASRSRGTLSKEMQQLEATRRQMILGGSDKVQAANNQIAGECLTSACACCSAAEPSGFVLCCGEQCHCRALCGLPEAAV
jgi:hypothetical protein